MPWCPICKNEYKEGYTHCNDCDADLVEQLPVAIMFGPKEDMDIMKQTLKTLGIDTSYVSDDEKDRTYELSVEKENVEKAKSLLKEYLEKEAANQLAEQMGYEADEIADDSSLAEMIMEKEACEEREAKNTYGDKAVKAEDYKSSAYTLALVGGIGILIIVLHALGVIPVTLPKTTQIMMYVVMGALFVIFLISSIFAFKSYKRLLKEDEIEKAFLKEAKEFLAGVSVDQVEAESDLSDTPDEMKYYKRIVVIKKIIEEKYPDAADGLIDYLAECYYDEQYGTDYDTSEADAYCISNDDDDEEDL